MVQPFVLFSAIEPRYEAIGWQALLSEPSWLVSLLILAVVACSVTIYSAWREQYALKPGRWKWLALIRLLALVSIGFLLAGWERRPVTEQTEPSRVILLVDGSTSMGLEAGSKDGQTIASNSKGASGSSSTRSELASKLVEQLSEKFAASHEVVEARFGSSLVYQSTQGNQNQPSEKAQPNEEVSDQIQQDFYAPRDQETRLGEALKKVLADYQSVPLAAVVLLSDGRSNGGIDPVRLLEQYANRGVPVHSIGLGPLAEPKCVQLRGLSLPSRVQMGDPFEATVRLAAQGEYEGTVNLDLFLVQESEESATEPIILDNGNIKDAELLLRDEVTFTRQTPIVVKRYEIDSPPAGRYRLISRLKALGNSSIAANRFESVDQKTTIMLLASAPLRDYRFLRDQLFRDDSFVVDACLQSASTGITQDVRNLLENFPDEMQKLDQYDVIVAHDVNWEEIEPDSLKLLQQWVLKKGGGLLVVKGASFEGQLVEQPTDSPLISLLPVRFLDDPLSLAIESAARNVALPIQVTSAGEQADFMQVSSSEDPLKAWQQIEGFYEQPLQTETKLGATIYASLGEEDSIDNDTRAMLVDQYYGAGRVAYLSSPEMWRLRSIDTNWFTAFYTRLLRHLARGRLRGSIAGGSLFFDRDQYQVGQTMSVRLTRSSNDANNQEPPVAKWLLPSGAVKEEPFKQVEGQINSFRSSITIKEPGEHRIQVKLPLFETPLSASVMAVLPPREIAKRTRNEPLLEELSNKTLGEYCVTIEQAMSLPEQTPSQAEVRMVLGEVDEEYSSRVARNTLWVVAALLGFEWLLRRLWRLA